MVLESWVKKSGINPEQMNKFNKIGIVGREDNLSNNPKYSRWEMSIRRK